eukprot:COSAG04_NODE_164_length_21771_cov_415.923219_10_plen_377_part_00
MTTRVTQDGAVGLASSFTQGGYDTAYIGKWHAHGSPEGRLERRAAFVPAESRFGFGGGLFKAFECSHNYNDSPYFDGDDPTLQHWEGYDTIAQTDAMCRFLRSREQSDASFFAALSWGTPHDPYDTAPEEYRAMYPPGCALELRPNIPADSVERATEELRGYYAHIAALDDCMGTLLRCLEETGLASDTIVCFTSDHGDMIGCQGIRGKHVPWDESIRVPFLVRIPPSVEPAANGRRIPLLMDAPDIMPTLLGLCELPIPATVQGRDFSATILGKEEVDPEMSCLLKVPVPCKRMPAAGRWLLADPSCCRQITGCGRRASRSFGGCGRGPTPTCGTSGGRGCSTTTSPTRTSRPTCSGLPARRPWRPSWRRCSRAG